MLTRVLTVANVAKLNNFVSTYNNLRDDNSEDISNANPGTHAQLTRLISLAHPCLRLFMELTALGSVSVMKLHCPGRSGISVGEK